MTTLTTIYFYNLSTCVCIFQPYTFVEFYQSRIPSATGKPIFTYKFLPILPNMQLTLAMWTWNFLEII